MLELMSSVLSIRRWKLRCSSIYVLNGNYKGSLYLMRLVTLPGIYILFDLSPKSVLYVIDFTMTLFLEYFGELCYDINISKRYIVLIFGQPKKEREREKQIHILLTKELEHNSTLVIFNGVEIQESYSDKHFGIFLDFYLENTYSKLKVRHTVPSRQLSYIYQLAFSFR